MHVRIGWERWEWEIELPCAVWLFVYQVCICMHVHGFFDVAMVAVCVYTKWAAMCCDYVLCIICACTPIPAVTITSTSTACKCPWCGRCLPSPSLHHFHDYMMWPMPAVTVTSSKLLDIRMCPWCAVTVTSSISRLHFRKLLDIRLEKNGLKGSSK